MELQLANVGTIVAFEDNELLPCALHIIIGLVAGVDSLIELLHNFTAFFVVIFYMR